MNKEKQIAYGKKKYNPKAKNPGFYRARRDTVVRVVKNKLFSGVVVVDDVPVDVEEGITEIYLPKIPSDVIKSIHNFFKYAYQEYKSEAIVLLWYNFNKDTWKVEVPKQTTSSASADYDRDPKFEERMRSTGFTFVGTIHSHGSMGAFHSGTDDNDEFGLDGLHITIGKVLNEPPQFACRFVLKDLELKRKPEEVMVIPEYKSKVPDDWKDQIQKKTYGKNKPHQGSLFNGGNWANDPYNAWIDDDPDDVSEKYPDGMVR